MLCAYSSDKTALKAATEYDPVRKTNVGKTVVVDEKFVLEITPRDQKILQNCLLRKLYIDVP